MNEMIYKVSVGELRQITNCLMPSIGKSTHPWLRAIRVKQDGNFLSWASADGYRITQISRPIEVENKFETYIPSFLIRALRSSKESFGHLRFYEDGSTCTAWDKSELTSCKIRIEPVANHFPPAGRIIPKKSQFTDILDTKDLKEVLKNLEAVCKSRKFAFVGVINFMPGHLSFVLNGGNDKLEYTTILPVETRHDPLPTKSIGIDFWYLRDLVKTLKAPKLRIGWNGPLGPIKIESYETVEGEDWHMEGVIMPLRIT